MANTTGKKWGGRTKGTPNKETQPIKEKFNQLLSSYSVEQMTTDLMSIENPAERMKIILGLAEFIIPKMARTEVTGEDGEAVQFKISLALD